MKKKKWILVVFVILIILLVFGIITLALVNEKDNTKEKLISTSWVNFRNEYYENDVLVDAKKDFDPQYYVIFSQDKAKYCNGKTQECIEYSYVYKSNKDKVVITINSGNYFLPKGSYDVFINEGNSLKLVNYSNNKKTVYFFAGSVG